MTTSSVHLVWVFYSLSEMSFLESGIPFKAVWKHAEVCWLHSHSPYTLPLGGGPPLISGMDGQTTAVFPKALLNITPLLHNAHTHTHTESGHEWTRHSDSWLEFCLTSIKKHAEPGCEDNMVRIHCFIDREEEGKQLFALDANKLSFTFKAENLCPWQDVWGPFQRY